MELKIRDVAELLGVSEKTVYRWVKEDAIPVYRINRQYRFSRSEIHDWIAQRHTTISHDPIAAANGSPVFLSDLLEEGGIFYKVEGTDAEQALRNAAKLLPIPFSASRDDVITQIVERERVYSTAIGRGVALPHPRSSALLGISRDLVALAFLESPLDFGALDGAPVHSLFLVLSCNESRHLEILAKITYLVHQTDLTGLLEKRAARGEILSYLRMNESSRIQSADSAISR